MHLKTLLIALVLLLNSLSVYAAIDAATVWECRQGATANNVNGGGFFDRNPGTSVDYSQQNTAQTSWVSGGADQTNDLATSGAGVTTLTSAAGGFTAAMAGNVIHITAGTNFQAGWYEVTVFTDANTVTLDRTPSSGGAGSSGTGYLGGSMSLNSTLDDDFFEQLVAGNTVYIKDEDSDFALGENIALTKDGTNALHVKFEGYKTTRGDNPTGANRPVIAAAANTLQFAQWWVIQNIIVTTTNTDGFQITTDSIFRNCKSTNSGAATRDAFTIGGNSRILDCEGISTNGNAISPTSSAMMISCYLHDSTNGVITASGLYILNSVIDTISATGVNMSFTGNNVIVNSVIYNCADGIKMNFGFNNVFINNIIDSCTTGASNNALRESNYFDYNCWNNTTDTSNVTKGDNAVTADPSMTNPGSGDFTLQSGSPCLDVGLQPGTDIGLTGDYKWNIGADQDDVAAGGGQNANGAVAAVF